MLSFPYFLSIFHRARLPPSQTRNYLGINNCFFKCSAFHIFYPFFIDRQGQTGRVFQVRVGSGSGIEKIFRVVLGREGWVIPNGYRVFVSNTKSFGYYGVLKSWSGIRRVSPLFPILSNIYYLIWLIWSIKHVFGRHIYVIVVQCGRSWQPFGDRRKSHKPLESAHLPVWHWT